MRAGERESVVMLLDLLHRNLPAANGVARLTIGSQLAPVNVRVAILTALPDIAEDRLHVTLHASHRLVHPSQRIPRLVVVEFRYGTDRPPSICRVAVLARNVEVPMRATRYIRSLPPRRARTGRTRDQSHCNEPEYAPST